jgi:SAM-dependent methyltransferase
MHRNSGLLFQKYAVPHFKPNMRVLEIGPGFPSPYQKMVGDDSIKWETIDIRNDPRLTYVAESEYSFPLADNTFDVVLSGQVMEHVRKIWKWMPELARVCEVGGLVITINPVSWPYHEHPYDCWRAFPEGMRALYEDSSLEVIESTFESLESSDNGNRIPGRSLEFQPIASRLRTRLLKAFGFPVECAFDTITIGRKTAPVAATT